MQVLELVHGLELGHVETVGQDTIRLSLEEMLAFVGCDVTDGGEDVRGVRRGALDTVSVVDAALAGLVIDIEVLHVVVEVDGACAEVSTEERRVGCEDCGHVDMTLSAERDGEAGLPLMEMSDDASSEIARCVFAEEPCDEVAEDDSLVGFVVVWWGRDAGEIPEIALPFVEPVVF